MQWQGGLCCKMSFMQRKPYLAMHVCASCPIEKFIEDNYKTPDCEKASLMKGFHNEISPTHD